MQWRIGMARRGIIVCMALFPLGLVFLPMSPATTVLICVMAAFGAIVGKLRLRHLETL
jgi:hypothetical protein